MAQTQIVTNPDTGEKFELPADWTPQQIEATLNQHYQGRSPQTAPPKEIEPNNSFGQWAGVATRAVAPTAIAAGAGGLAAAPTGVGVPFGAASGVAALNLTDLGSMVASPISTLFGGPKIPSGSQAIQNNLDKIGIGKKPQTSGQQIVSDVLQAATSAGGLVTAMPMLGDKLREPITKALLKQLGAQPKMQVASAAGGAAAPSIASNHFGVTDPLALTALGVGGSMVGGSRFAQAPKPIDASVFKNKSQIFYEALDQANVRLRPTALRTKLRDLDQTLVSEGFVPRTMPDVVKWRNDLSALSSRSLSFKTLDTLHSQIMAKARTLQASDPTEAALLRTMGHEIDDLLVRAEPSQITGSRDAPRLLGEARKAWAQQKKTQVMETALERAKTLQEQSMNNPDARTRNIENATRQAFREIVNKPKVFNWFSPEEQKALRAISNGTVLSRGAGALAGLAPNNFRTAGSELGLPAALSYYFTDNVGPGLWTGLGLMATGQASKKISDTLLNRQVTKAQKEVSGLSEPSVFPVRAGVSSRAALEAISRPTSPEQDQMWQDAIRNQLLRRKGFGFFKQGN